MTTLTKYALPPVTGVKLCQGDCVELMRGIEPGSVDVVFADPPYFATGKNSVTAKSGKRVKVAHGAWDRPIGGVDAELAFHRRWLHAARATMAPSATIWVCGNYKSIGTVLVALQATGFRFLNLVTWSKPNAPPNLGCRQLRHSSEFLAWCSLGQKAKHYFDYRISRTLAPDAEGNARQLLDVWTMSARITAAEKAHGGHPTQKPVALLERALAISLPPRGLVLDPFCGVASAGVAAARLDGRYLGFDLDAGFLAIGAKRLALGGK